MFVICDLHNRDAKKKCRKYLGSRSVGDSQVRLLADNGGNEPQRAGASSPYLQELFLSIMMTHDFAIQMEYFHHFNNLVGVTPGHEHGIAERFKFRDNRSEKRNMRRIVEVNPDLFARCFWP